MVHSALFLPTQGGAELYIDNICKNLQNSYDVTILTRPSRASWRVTTRHRIIRLRSWLIPFYFIWIVIRKRPDVLHVGLIGYESFLLFGIARLARIPCILTFHGTYSLSSGAAARIPPQVLALEDVVLRLPWEKVVCVDYHSENFLIHRLIPQSNLCVIPSGVDIDEFFPQPQELQHDSTSHYTILCPRRVDPKNGIEYLIQATIKSKPKISGLRLLIAGRTNEGLEGYETFLRNMVRSNGGESYITFLGDVEHNKMRGLYNSADLIVVPSLAEARSLSALEAMACEKAVIATNVGGLPEIIRDGISGILVNPANVDDLTRAICRAYQEPELCRDLGRNARLVALDNNWKVRSREYESVYESSLKSLHNKSSESLLPTSQETK